MKQRAPTVQDDDSRLFREAIGDVRPMAPVEAVPERPRPAPHPHMRDADEAAVPADSLIFDYDPAELEGPSTTSNRIPMSSMAVLVPERLPRDSKKPSTRRE